MSFGNQNQKDGISITLGGVNETDLATVQKGIPVPYLAGEGAPPVIWLCDPFDPDPVEIPATPASGKASGKASGGTSTGRYNIFGSIGGLFCHGPIDEIIFAETDQIRRWNGNYALGTSNPAPLSLPGVGNYRIFIGTTDQPAWGMPSVSWSSVPHPRYNNFAGFMADHILYGENRGAPPSHRFGLRRRPRQSLITGAAALLDDGQANPFSVLAEWLTSPYCGLGLPTALFNQERWQAAADAAYANRALCYVSVMLSSRQQVKSLAADLFVLCDGYWRVDLETGGADVGVWPQPETINSSALPKVSYRGLIDPPKMDAETLDDVITHFICNYTDRDKNFQSYPVSHDDAGAEGGLGQDRTENISRPYIARRDQALAHLREYARRRSLPGLSGSGADRQQIASDLRPGEHVNIDVELEPGGLELIQTCRVTSVEHPAMGAPTLKFEAERTLTPVPFLPIEPPPPQEEVVIADIVYASFFELPPQLSDGSEYAVGVLAERPAPLVTECAVYYDPANDTSATFPLLGTHRSYALRAQLSASATDAATTLSLSLLSALSREHIASDPGPVAARNNELLLILLHAPSGGQTIMEICSVDSLVATGTDAVDVTLLRGRCGTAPVAHASATAAWFIRRDALPWYRHNDFPARANAAQTCYLRLQPSTDSAARALEDCAARAFVFDSVRAFAPVITVTAPATNPAGVEVNHALACSGSVDDADGNLVSLTVIRSKDGLDEIVLDRSFAPTARMTFSLAAVAFNQEGSAALIIRAQDSTRRTIEKRINVVVGAAGGGGTIPTDKIKPPIIYGDAHLFITPGPPSNSPAYPYAPYYAAAAESLDPPPINYTLAWASIASPTIDTLAIHSPADGPGSIVGPTVPAIEHYVATSAIGASSPETGWKSVQPYAINTDNADEFYIYNVKGGSPGNYASVWSESFLRSALYPRVEAGVRLWCYAHDIHGVLLDSEIVYYDLYF